MDNIEVGDIVTCIGERHRYGYLVTGVTGTRITISGVPVPGLERGRQGDLGHWEAMNFKIHTKRTPPKLTCAEDMDKLYG